MKAKREFYKSIKDLPATEALVPGSPLCAGCGGLTTLRLMHNVLGENVVVVNAAGCMTLMAVYPFTPLRSSWLYTTMGSPSAGCARNSRCARCIARSRQVGRSRRSPSTGAGGRRFDLRHGALFNVGSDSSPARFLVSLLRQRGLRQHRVSNVERFALWFAHRYFVGRYYQAKEELVQRLAGAAAALSGDCFGA